MIWATAGAEACQHNRHSRRIRRSKFLWIRAWRAHPSHVKLFQQQTKKQQLLRRRVQRNLVHQLWSSSSSACLMRGQNSARLRSSSARQRCRQRTTRLTCSALPTFMKMTLNKKTSIWRNSKLWITSACTVSSSLRTEVRFFILEALMLSNIARQIYCSRTRFSR